MGRKQFRRRKYLLFLVTGLILFLSVGCASLEKFFGEETPLSEGKTTNQNEKSDTAKSNLLEAKRLFRNGEYEAAFREYQKVVVLLKKKPPADEALYSMGLILTYPENPRKDSRRSMEFMKSLITDFPHSFYVEPAKAWIGALQENERLSKTSEKTLQEKETLTKELEKLSRVHDKTVKDYEKIVRENEKLNKMMEEYKQVDIEMEGRKRERGR
jgi:outer membrane protein assembly factor BamD (BamD/ComL family)